MAKIKLLYATRAYESLPHEGGFVLLSDLANSLGKAKDVEVSFFSKKKLRNAHIRGVPVFSKTGWGLRQKIEFFVGIMVNAHKYNIVHTAHIPTDKNALLMKICSWRAKRSGTFFVQTITGLPSYDLSTKQAKKLLWGDIIVCQSENAQSLLKKNSSSIKIIPPQTSPERVIFSNNRRAETRKNLGTKGPLIVFPGEFDRLGIDDDFAKCLETFLNKLPHAQILLACRFDHQKRGEHFASKFKQVKTVGTVNSIIPILEAADLIIYPVRLMDSKFNPPLVIIEALQLKRNVLVGDLIALPGSISNHLYRTSTEDWVKFAHEMIKIATRKDNLSKNTVINYTFDGMTANYRELYNAAK